MGKLPFLFVSGLFVIGGVAAVLGGNMSSISTTGAILAGAGLIAIAITLAHPPWPQN